MVSGVFFFPQKLRLFVAVFFSKKKAFEKVVVVFCIKIRIFFKKMEWIFFGLLEGFDWFFEHGLKSVFF